MDYRICCQLVPSETIVMEVAVVRVVCGVSVKSLYDDIFTVAPVLFTITYILLAQVEAVGNVMVPAPEL